MTPTDELARAHGWESYDAYLASAAWRARRRRLLDLAGHRCEWMEGDERCVHRRRLHVHHLTYDRFGAEADDDLAVLCPTHHNMAHGRDTPPRPDRPVSVAAVARLVWATVAWSAAVAVVWVAAGGPTPDTLAEAWDLTVQAAGWMAGYLWLLARVLAGMAWEAVEWAARAGWR